MRPIRREPKAKAIPGTRGHYPFSEALFRRANLRCKATLSRNRLGVWKWEVGVYPRDGAGLLMERGRALRYKTAERRATLAFKAYKHPESNVMWRGFVVDERGRRRADGYFGRIEEIVGGW